MSIQSVVEAEPEFDEYADNYNDSLENGLRLSGEDSTFFAARRVDWMANRSDVTPAKILDFGCGTGGSIPFLRRQFNPQVLVGIDPSESSLAVARRNNPQPECQFLCAEDFTAFNHFELAYCNGVFHHIPPDERAENLEFIHRSLKQNGIFAFWENNPWNPGTRLVMSRIPFDRDAITITPPEARRLLKSAGFQIISTEFLFLFPKPLAWCRPLENWVSRLPLGAQYVVLCRK